MLKKSTSGLRAFERTVAVWGLVRAQVYAVTKDGRFLVTVTPQKASGAAPLTVVLNWTKTIHK